jgi:hypothetical protein
MTIQELLEAVQDDQSVVIDGKTFEPHSIDEIELETGEMIYWVREEDSWLSIDEGSEEVIIFQDVDEDAEIDEDTLIYRGDDYELSIEVSGSLVDSGQTLDSVTYRDFENNDGEVFRTIQMGMAADLSFASGRKLSDVQIQAL